MQAQHPMELPYRSRLPSGRIVHAREPIAVVARLYRHDRKHHDQLATAVAWTAEEVLVVWHEDGMIAASQLWIPATTVRRRGNQQQIAETASSEAPARPPTASSGRTPPLAWRRDGG